MRARANGLMADTFTPYSPTTDTQTDADGYKIPIYALEVPTQGKINPPSMQSRDTNAREVVIGGVSRPVVEGGLHIPITAEPPAVGEYGFGWEYVLSTLGPLTDPSLLNSRWLVVDAPAKSYATARRLDVVRLA